MVTWWDLTTEDEKPRQKWETTLCFFIMQMPKHSLWKPSAVMHNAAIAPPREKVKVNPIGEITQMYFYPSSFLSKHHEACQSTAPSISDLSALLGLSWRPPCLKPGDKVTSAPRCLQSVCSGLRRHEPSEDCANPVGLHEILRTRGVPQRLKLACCKAEKTTECLSESCL